MKKGAWKTISSSGFVTKGVQISDGVVETPKETIYDHAVH